MKYTLYIFIALTAFSCKTSSKDDAERNSAQVDQTTIESEPEKAVDTNETEEFPTWLRELYPDTVKEGRTPPYEEVRTLKVFTRLNDSVTYCIYEVMANGIAYHSVVATQVWKMPRQEELIASGNDHMEEEQVRESIDYEVLDSNTILVIEYTEFVPDSVIQKKGTLDDEVIYDSDDWVVLSEEYILEILTTGIIETP